MACTEQAAPEATDAPDATVTDDGGDAEATQAPEEQKELKKVDFLLNWTIAADHSPYYVALDKGWYEEAGLDVNIIIGQGSGYSVTAVDAGTADIAIADAPVVLQYRAQDAKTKIIGIIFDNHPNAMYFWDDSGMTSRPHRRQDGRRAGDGRAQGHVAGVCRHDRRGPGQRGIHQHRVHGQGLRARVA